MENALDRLHTFLKEHIEGWGEMPQVTIMSYPVYSDLYWRVIISVKKFSVMKAVPNFNLSIHGALDLFDRVKRMQNVPTPEDVSVENRYHHIEYDKNKFIHFKTFQGRNHVDSFSEKDDDGFTIILEGELKREFPNQEFIRKIDDRLDLYSYNDIQLLSGDAGFIKIERETGRVVAMNCTMMA